MSGQDSDALLGQQLGSYLIQHPLGRGGMARVYKGLDVILKRPVAIKVIAENLRGSSNYAQRFEREAQSVANLKHPNIVTVFQFGSENGLFYLVMEYIDGADLDAIMRNYENNGELMPHTDVVRILQATASALDFAHAHGVVHRDIKPSNIMLERDGRPVLTDFGLALRVSEGTLGATFGSPHYISPEQARSSADAVPQSDIYSLGVVAYELLAGVVPFDDPNPTALAMQHIMMEVPSPRIFNRDLSPQVEAVLMRALAKQPADRYATAAEFITDLQQALEKLKQNPAKIATADLPPLPPGITPPPPRRLSMQTALDKIDQELALAQAKGQALTRGPIARAAPKPAVDELVAVPPAKRPALLPLALIGLVVIGVLGAAVLGLGRSGSVTPTSAVTNAANLPTIAPTNSLIDSPTNQPTVAVTSVSPMPAVLPTNVPPPTAIPTTAVILPTTAPTTAPTIIPTTLPTETLLPTLLPSATSIPPSPVPTNAPVLATATPVMIAAAPTVAYPDGAKMVAVYDDNGLFLANQGAKQLSINLISFERILNDGQFGEKYVGGRWAANYRFIELNRCVVVWYPKKNAPRPRADCPAGINSEITAQTREFFWTTADNSTEFRVLWQDQEIARCQIAAKRCEFRVPIQ